MRFAATVTKAGRLTVVPRDGGAERGRAVDVSDLATGPGDRHHEMANACVPTWHRAWPSSGCKPGQGDGRRDPDSQGAVR